MTGLAYAGKIIETSPIPGADRIILATAICGSGGKWRGVVSKGIDRDNIVVILPDSIVPESDPDFKFMEGYHYRVRQRRFKGVPSECLILEDKTKSDIGTDLTTNLGIIKYEKPSISAEALGDFPGFIPKTDEPLLQKVSNMLDHLNGKPYIITLKMDGSSTTAYNYNGHFGVCSRNQELKPGDNAYWRVARKYNLENHLDEGMAIQYETCGPKVQNNKIGLKEIDGYAFQGYDIRSGVYLREVGGIMNHVPIIEQGDSFQYNQDELQFMAEGMRYKNGSPAEGIVVRPMEEMRVSIGLENLRLSFKVINLLYRD